MPGPTTSTNTLPATSKPLDQVILWLLDGHRAADVLEAIKDKMPGADPDKLLSRATDHFRIVADADADVLRGWCFEAYRELYRKMVEVGDYKGAIAAIKELSREAAKQPRNETDVQSDYAENTQA